MSETQKIVEAVARYKAHGWIPGGNGAVALLCPITESSKKIYITPSNIKSLTQNDLFMLRDTYGAQDVQTPLNKEEGAMTEWASLFMHILQTCPNTRAVIQVATKWTALAARSALLTWRNTASNFPNVFRLSHWPALKQLTNKQELEIPIINHGSNMVMEGKAMLSVYPDTFAILVRDYGAIVWGDSLDDAEGKVEVLEHLSELQINSNSLLSNKDL